MQVATSGTMHVAAWTYILRQLLGMLVWVLACQGARHIRKLLWRRLWCLHCCTPLHHYSTSCKRTNYAVCYLQTLPCCPPETRRRLGRRG